MSAVDPEEQSTRRATLIFEVKERTSAPGVGSPSITSVNRTIRDVERISQLTTGSLQDPDLYQLTIAEAGKKRAANGGGDG